MPDKIRGITIEIGGDTTGLSKALKGVNSEISSTQRQLKDVEKLLKLDPTNTELLEQKQRLLGNQVKNTRNKLAELKEIQQNMDKNGVDKNSAQYMALQREIIATENSLKELEDAARHSNAEIAKISATCDKVSAGANKVASATKGISTAAAGAIAGIAGMAYKSVTAADDLNTLAKQSGFTTAEIQKMQYAADLIDVDSDTIISSMSKMRKQMVSTSGETVAAFDRIGVRTTDMNGNLRDSTEVFYEVLQGLSRIQNETERDTLAMQIFGKSADQLAGIIDDGGKALKDLGQQAEDLGLIIDQQTLDSLNAVNDQIDTLKANAAGVLAQSGAKAMEALMPVFDKIVAAVSKLLDTIGSLKPETVELILKLLAGLALVSPLASGVGKVADGIKGIVNLIPSVGAAFTRLNSIIVSPMALVIAAIAAVVLAIAKYGDQIQAKLAELDAFLQGIFARDWTETFGALGKPLNVLFSGIKTIWDGIKGVLDGIIDFIRGVFTGDWKRAWTGVKEIFFGVFSTLAAIVKAPVNAIIGLVNGLINLVNKAIDGLNTISVDIPSWVPGIGGKKFGLNLKHIGSIPYLAKGGILSEGSAIVGERGPELLTMTGNRAVVQPLTATIDARSLSAFQGNGVQNINLHLNFDGSLSQLAKVLHPYMTAESSRIGISLIK